MTSFIIFPTLSWYTNPHTNSLQKGLFLQNPVQAYYHADYHSGNQMQRETVGTIENIITTLKNQFKDKSQDLLRQAGKRLITILNTDLPQVLRQEKKIELVACVIPRAKPESAYINTQLVFKKAVKASIVNLKGFIDGTNYIVRHTSTRTTHMDKSGYGGNGNLPYPGITKETCTISDKIKNKDILLIDDLYTAKVNIDEDAIQTLLDKGANSVIFYSLGKTIKEINK